MALSSELGWQTFQLKYLSETGVSAAGLESLTPLKTVFKSSTDDGGQLLCPDEPFIPQLDHKGAEKSVCLEASK